MGGVVVSGWGKKKSYNAVVSEDDRRKEKKRKKKKKKNAQRSGAAQQRTRSSAVRCGGGSNFGGISVVDGGGGGSVGKKKMEQTTNNGSALLPSFDAHEETLENPISENPQDHKHDRAPLIGVGDEAILPQQEAPVICAKSDKEREVGGGIERFQYKPPVLHPRRFLKARDGDRHMSVRQSAPLLDFRRLASVRGPHTSSRTHTSISEESRGLPRDHNHLSFISRLAEPSYDPRNSDNEPNLYRQRQIMEAEQRQKGQKAKEERLAARRRAFKEILGISPGKATESLARTNDSIVSQDSSTVTTEMGVNPIITTSSSSSSSSSLFSTRDKYKIENETTRVESASQNFHASEEVRGSVAECISQARAVGHILSEGDQEIDLGDDFLREYIRDGVHLESPKDEVVRISQALLPQKDKEEDVDAVEHHIEDSAKSTREEEETEVSTLPQSPMGEEEEEVKEEEEEEEEGLGRDEEEKTDVTERRRSTTIFISAAANSPGPSATAMARQHAHEEMERRRQRKLAKLENRHHGGGRRRNASRRMPSGEGGGGRRRRGRGGGENAKKWRTRSERGYGGEVSPRLDTQVASEDGSASHLRRPGWGAEAEFGVAGERGDIIGGPTSNHRPPNKHLLPSPQAAQLQRLRRASESHRAMVVDRARYIEHHEYDRPKDAPRCARGSGSSRRRALPPRPSNIKLVRLAISHCCLAGHHVRSAKDEALCVLKEVEKNARARGSPLQLLVLFGSEEALNFKGLYLRRFHQGPNQAGTAGGGGGGRRSTLERLCGVGPATIIESQFVSFFKYNSSGRCFRKLRTQTITSTTDGVAISKIETAKRDRWEERDGEQGGSSRRQYQYTY